jgi:hypothetical protein
MTDVARFLCCCALLSLLYFRIFDFVCKITSLCSKTKDSWTWDYPNTNPMQKSSEHSEAQPWDSCLKNNDDENEKFYNISLVED